MKSETFTGVLNFAEVVRRYNAVTSMLVQEFSGFPRPRTLAS